MAITRDHENFNESMKWLLDPKTSGEAARLRNLQLWKIEQRPMLMKLCTQLDGNRGDAGRPFAGTVLGDSPTAPCCEKLPVELGRNPRG
jgi:hypothetical protein